MKEFVRAAGVSTEYVDLSNFVVAVCTCLFVDSIYTHYICCGNCDSKFSKVMSINNSGAKCPKCGVLNTW